MSFTKTDVHIGSKEFMVMCWHEKYGTEFPSDFETYDIMSPIAMEFHQYCLERALGIVIQEQRRLTSRAVDFAPRCPKCNAVAGWHHEACEDYTPETQSH